MKTITVPTLSKITPTEPMLEHAIRLRSYELYAQRGMTEGHAVHDWLAAEAELLHGIQRRIPTQGPKSQGDVMASLDTQFQPRASE